MKISEIYKNNKRSLSFEIFPPKKDTELSSIDETLKVLCELNPDFISVTFGAGGSANSNRTIEIAKNIKKRYGVEPVVHLTSLHYDKAEIDEFAKVMEAEGIENILALRGDRPADFTGDYLKYFKHASELMEHLRQEHNFCLGGACYPEGHIECESLYDDLINLKIKQDKGASFFITQVFYDNNYYYRLVRAAKKMGITVPIIPGIMPLTNATLFNKIMNMAGASIPFELRVLFDRFRGDKKAMREIGIAYSINQILELLANDADGIHIYTMNHSEVAKEIYSRIHNVIDNELR